MNERPDSGPRVVEFRHWLFSRNGIAALVGPLALAILIGLLLWSQKDIFANSSARKVVDLSDLFKDGANKTLDGDFLDLRDPPCTKSFPLRLTQKVFIRMSRNCTYVISVDRGRARANFLNASKGAVELAPGRSWSGSDFWSLNPLTPEVELRLEPTS
jgi:hypothetical protein